MRAILAFFEERLEEQGLCIFGETVSVLLPALQFDFLKIVRRIQLAGKRPVLMATHSPILMALPGADLRHVNRLEIEPIALDDTPHLRLFRQFILYPEEAMEAMTHWHVPTQGGLPSLLGFACAAALPI